MALEKWIDIIIEYNGTMLFPTNPEEISISRGTRNITHDVLELGEIVLPNTPDLERISFTSQFWAEQAPQTSGDYLAWLNKWREDKKPGRLIIVNNHAESAYHGLNMPVLCDSFDTNEGKAGAEDDVYFTLNLIEYREEGGRAEVEIETDPVTNEQYIVEAPPARINESPPPSAVHTVQPGDNLWNIAKSYGKSGTDWTELYAIPENRQIIGENPHLIRPNQQLIIPQSWTG